MVFKQLFRRRNGDDHKEVDDLEALVGCAFKDDDPEAARTAWNQLLGSFLLEQDVILQPRRIAGLGYLWEERRFPPAFAAIMLRGVALGLLTEESARWWMTKATSDRIAGA